MILQAMPSFRNTSKKSFIRKLGLQFRDARTELAFLLFYAFESHLVVTLGTTLVMLYSTAYLVCPSFRELLHSFPLRPVISR
jgi:hypothetical protein